MQSFTSFPFFKPKHTITIRPFYRLIDRGLEHKSCLKLYSGTYFMCSASWILHCMKENIYNHPDDFTSGVSRLPQLTRVCGPGWLIPHSSVPWYTMFHGPLRVSTWDRCYCLPAQVLSYLFFRTALCYLHPCYYYSHLPFTTRDVSLFCTELTSWLCILHALAILSKLALHRLIVYNAMNASSNQIFECFFDNPKAGAYASRL